MIGYRPLLNSDSPDIIELWKSQPPLRRRLAKPTLLILEQHLFSKPYFDPTGFIVAAENERIIGFVHAGFSPGKHAGELDRESGFICMLMVEARADRDVIGRELLERGEVYLREKGAKELIAGPIGLRSPFYLGLYGGSNLPGVLLGDSMADTLRAAGYQEVQEQIVLGRELADFRPPVDRQFMQLRRQMKLVPAAELEPAGWEECCIRSWIQCSRLGVVAGSDPEPLATFDFWDMEPLSSEWGCRSVGLIRTQLKDASRGDILACFLGESMRQFLEHGISFIEIQPPPDEPLVADAARRLGFQQVDRGLQFRK